MTVSIPLVNTAVDTFQVWVDRTNQAINAVSNNMVSVDVTAAGSVSTGNGHVNGIFSSLTLAANTLRGGNVGTSGVLHVTSNVSVGNSTVNTQFSNALINVGLLSVNATVFKSGANVQLTDTVLLIGNSTINVVVNSTSFAAGANVVLGLSDLKVGNSTVNSVVNSSALTLGPAAVNSTSFKSGANVVLNDTLLSIGNSTVNVVVNSTVVSIGGTNASVVGHTHTSGAITDFSEAVDDRVFALAIGGDGLTITYDDPAGTLTWAVGSGTGVVVGADTVSIDKATNTNVWAAATNKVLTTDHLQTAAAAVTVTFATPLIIDWKTLINSNKVTVTSNFTLNAFTNPIPGTWRRIKFLQDATGGRTISFEASRFRAAGGLSTIVLSTAASALDVLDVFCESSTEFWLSIQKDVKA